MEDLKNLNLTAQLNAMQTDLYKNLPRQLLIFDACANSQLLKITPPDDLPAIGTHLPSQKQMAMLAANPGEYAINKSDEQTGIFSRELLNELSLLKDTEVWLPDMEVVMQNVQQKFIKLREDGQTKQTPSFFLYQDWAGNIKERFSEIEPATRTREQDTFQLPRNLTIKELGLLRDLFLECQSIRDPQSRKDIILNLRREIANNIIMEGNPNTVVLSVIKTSRGYSGGLAELLDVIDMLYENDSVAMQNLRRTTIQILPEEFENENVELENLYPTLLKLGYHKQVSFFLQLIQTKSVAAFLIHGLPNYGQRWLLNRLVVQYVPYFLKDKIIKVNVNRKIRRNDIRGLWREIAVHVGLKGKQDTPSEITKQVYQCLQTQNVLLVFHEVQTMSENTLSELIDGLWLPLVSKIQHLSQAQHQPSPANKYKLLMFLIDYEGCVGSWEFPFAEQLNSHAEPKIIFKPPIITEFSDNDLMYWINAEFDKLPSALTAQVQNKVKEILENSDNGVPELVLEIICTDCDCNWYEESEKWLKL